MSAPGATGPADADAVAHIFVDALSDRCEIVGDDGHHLQRVRRVVVGEHVTAADGTGAWREYAVAAVSSGRLVLEASAGARVEAPPPVGIALAVALTKGGLDGIVASVTELGATRVTPLCTERTVVRWDGARAAHAVGRLRGVARSAAMQARRARIPLVDDPVALEQVMGRPDVVVADRAGRRAADLTHPASSEWTVVVGPEGGFSPAEHGFFGAAARLALGRHVLRASTAPVAAVAVLAERAAGFARPRQWGPSEKS